LALKRIEIDVFAVLLPTNRAALLLPNLSKRKRKKKIALFTASARSLSPRIVVQWSNAMCKSSSPPIVYQFV
jgi:hypothetical protein